MRRSVVFLGFGIAIFINQEVLAVAEHTLNPFVTIFKSESGENVEILAAKTDFFAVYNISLGSFIPLQIPFQVRSVYGNAIEYNISLSFSQHFCQSDVDSPFYVWDGISLLLDNTPFNEDSTVNVYGAVYHSHILGVNFPKIKQTDKIQHCSGTIGLVAGVQI